MTQTVTYLDYRPKGAAKGLFSCRSPEVLLVGPAGTGKTRAVLEYINWLCEQYDGIRVLICRQTRVSLTESVLVTWETKVLYRGHPALRGSDANRANRHSYRYPNRSEVIVGGLDNPDRIMSTEYDVVYVAEATETTEEAVEKLASRLRNNVLPWQQLVCDCNPAHPGHWLKKRADRGAMVTLRSRHEDNPSLTPEYLTRLSALTGHRRARLYEGRWVAAEGSVFGTEFDPARNVIEPFPVPEDWPWVYCIDPGWAHVTAIGGHAIAPNGTIYLAELRYQSGATIAAHAQWVLDSIRGKNIRSVMLDPRHGFIKTAQSPKTIAEQFAECGVETVPWPRKAGVQVEALVNVIRQMLINGKLKVFSNCPDAINEFQTWAYKRNAAGEAAGSDDSFVDASNDYLDGLIGLVSSELYTSYETQRTEYYR